MVITRYGIVATSQTLASAAGVRILEMGGSAVDAAIAANATLGLVEPMMCGIGGDLFAIIYEAKTGKLYGLNSSGWAPSGLTPAFLKARHLKRVPAAGIYSVTVPGAVAGWQALHDRFGRLPLAKLLAPAIGYAGEGFPVTEIIAAEWRAAERKLARTRSAAATYFVDGKPPQAGAIFRNPDLAESLRRIAQQGRDGFYRGATAEAILRLSGENGGTFTAADLADFQPEWVEPISTTYRGWTVYEMPPNGMGVAALAMLNILERFPLKEYGHNSARALDTMIEAKKLAYADMLEYVGDPRRSKVPVAQLISKEYAAKRAAEIKPEKAACHVTPLSLQDLAAMPGGDTIYLSVVDQEGNMVSFIQSNYSSFGSGLVPPGAGFALQNRGSLFTLQEGKNNTLEPHKRPLHTIIPAFMEKDGVRIAFGIMGGWNQAQAHAQFVANIVDYGMNIQAALEAPRFTKLDFDGCDVQIESRVSPEVIAELRKMGHDVHLAGAFNGEMGGGQAVLVNPAGIHFGASDPRKDGAAYPQTPVF